MRLSSIKDVYRQRILEIEPYIKVNNVCKQCGIANTNMSLFLKKGRDERISVEKLDRFLNFIENLPK